MILTPKKYQRGNFAMFPAGTMAILSPPITLSGGAGGTVQQIDGAAPYDTTVAIRFNVDGTIETGKAVNGGAIVWTAAGNWITGAAADATYDVRTTNVVTTIGIGNWTTQAAANDVWISMAAQRVYISNKTTSGNRVFTCDMEVRKNAGPPPVTGISSYTFNIDNVV